MDLLFLRYPTRDSVYLNKFGETVNGLSSYFSGLNVEENSDYTVWHHETGESIFFNNAFFDIWFDGYVHSIGAQTIADYLELLAERMVQKNVALHGEESGIFNISIIDKKTKKLYLANDPGGLFPLYYTVQDKTFYASTHLYLLAKALNAKPDYVQVIAKEVFGYAVGPFTYFNGIKRLLPGELVIFDPHNGTTQSKLTETFFQGYRKPGKDILERVYHALEKPIKSIVEQDPTVGVMLSEGFDSRLLASLFKRAGAEVSSYTHGTTGTKGMREAERVAAKLGLNHHYEDAIFPSNQDQIKSLLLLSDNLHVPFWHGGSAYFRKTVANIVTAGTALDSTLGGHIFYKSSRNRAKAIFQRYQEIVRQNLGIISDQYIEKLSQELIDNFLDIDIKRLARRINERFVPDIAEILLSQFDLFIDCLESEFQRLADTGSTLPSLQLQRFFLDHRARRFSYGQELMLRINNRVVVPSYERIFLQEVTTIPIAYKLNHGLYLRLLRKYFPISASIPTGNYLLPANFPRFFLESSRFLGKVIDLNLIKKYLDNKGQTKYNGFRGALFQDYNGHDEKVFNYFYSLFKRNGSVINKIFYENFLARIDSYQSRTYQFDYFYRAIEFCQIFQHTF